MSGALRIIGGEWKGRRFRVGHGPGLRPTADRNRETLFNWLQADMPGARVLDLFAGTGALGLEALSRGAAEAVFVERAKPLARALNDRLKLLEATDRAWVVADDARRYLQRQGGGFDVVFLDPPFDSDLLAPTLQALAAPGWLHAHSAIYLESGDSQIAQNLPDGWALEREKRAGAVWFALVRAAQ